MLAADIQASRILGILAVIKAKELAVNRKAIHMLGILATSAEDIVIINKVRLKPSSFEEEHQAKDKPSFKVAESSLAKSS